MFFTFLQSLMCRTNDDAPEVLSCTNEQAAYDGYNSSATVWEVEEFEADLVRAF